MTPSRSSRQASNRPNSQRPPPRANQSLKVRWIEEPTLVFADGRRATDPKEGLSLYGPYGISSNEHPESIRIGFVGSDVTIAQARNWFVRCGDLVPGKKDKRRQFPDFPGFNKDTAFVSEFTYNPDWDSAISQRDLASLLTIKDRVIGFEKAVNLFASKVQLISEVHPTDVIVCALPQEVEDYYATIGTDDVRASVWGQMTPMARAIRRIIREADERGQTTFLRTLFPAESEATPSLLGRNFRRALKARTNRANCPVQIMRQRSLMEGNPDAQDPASRAWNIVVGMYYKGKGRPWQVEGLDPQACYIGISFFHHITAESHTVHSSLAQVFTTHGDNLILRGDKFEWDPDQQGRQPHLTEDHALDLITNVLETYRKYKEVLPRRVVVHKTSRYWEEEKRGFETGLANLQIARYDLISLDTSGTRFFREGNYPPVRGTWCRVGRTGDWIYTMGYLPTQGTYPRAYVPKPLQLIDRYGDSTAENAIREILALSKMNWNSADYATLYPITLHFARKVGEILSYLPEDVAPNPSFRFYC